MNDNILPFKNFDLPKKRSDRNTSAYISAVLCDELEALIAKEFTHLIVDEVFKHTYESMACLVREVVDKLPPK